MGAGNQKIVVLGAVRIGIGLLSSGAGYIDCVKIAEPIRDDGYVLPNHRHPERKLKKSKKK